VVLYLDVIFVRIVIEWTWVDWALKFALRIFVIFPISMWYDDHIDAFVHTSHQEITQSILVLRIAPTH